jgi:hypothetical protein
LTNIGDQLSLDKTKKQYNIEDTKGDKNVNAILNNIYEDNSDDRVIELIMESDDYAEWVQNNAYEYGYIVCNGDTLIEAMEADELMLAYLRHIDYK